MTASYGASFAASYLPVIFVPLLAIAAFAVMGLLFTYIESEAEG
ncbi:MAG: photosystem I reaction center subunit VIII [Prochloraceae cyanobacterium]